MNRIQIAMSADRNRCGTLRVFGAGQKLLAGPFAVAARATDSLAAANGNPSRDPLFRYGDPPSGGYRLLARQPTGGRHGFAADEYGPALLLLRPVAGDAALAEANGRYTMAIIGGEPAPSGRLRSAAGAFRLANADLRALIKALGKSPEGVFCQCDLAPPVARAARVEDAPCDQTDPISAGITRPTVSRREALLATAGAAGAFAARGAITFVAVSAFANPARAQVAYHGAADISGGQVPVQVDAPATQIATDIAPTVDDNVGNVIDALTSDDMPKEAVSELKGALNDKALEMIVEAHPVVPSGSLPWLTSAGLLAGGLAGAANRAVNGDMAGATGALKTTLVDALPETVSAAVGVALAPILIEATTSIAIGAAITLSLPASSLVVTSVVVAIGVNAVVSLGTKRLTKVGIEYVNSRLNQ